MEDLAEKAFQQWIEDNQKKLNEHYPATVGWNGAANNWTHWCRQVYTGRIILP